LKVPFLTRGAIEQVAEALLKRALADRSHQLPIDLDCVVYDHLCENDGLIFLEDQKLGSEGGYEILGRTELIAGRILVCASLKISDPRRFRFTVAHELGHWMLHRPLRLMKRTNAELFPEDTVFVSSTVSESRVGIGLEPHEWQANCFASHLLMPRPALRQEFANRFGDCPIVRPERTPLRTHSRRVARDSIGGSVSIADAFAMSIEATAIALEEMRLVVDEPVLL
jgi:Zn-dependent peptidase ImmA (M78 family)